MSDDGLYFGPHPPDTANTWTDKQLAEFAAEWRRKATGRTRLLTPLPRRVRLRLAFWRAVGQLAGWLWDHRMHRAAEWLWRH